MIPSDPLYASQWHFGQIGNIQRIWDEYTGAGVSVVVYDDGVQGTHRDLRNNFDATAEFTFNRITYDSSPMTADAAHGTAVAGIIGATEGNSAGGVGVAFGATLAAVNYLDDIQYYHTSQNAANLAIYDAAVRYAAGFDIMSNSWGWNGYFTIDQRINAGNRYAQRDTTLFAEISAIGRDGLGTVIVKSAGNSARDTGGDGWEVSRHTITVAATVEDGFAADYSNYGASVLISAPDASVTTDLTGTRGYNVSDRDDDTVSVDYTEQFGGTSASAPVVSGVVALMLDANAGLGWRDVQSILTLSAGHTGSAYDAAEGTATEYGEWSIAGDTNWNGGGRAFHASYGFGIVDAFAAVRMAEAWATFGMPAATSANESTANVRAFYYNYGLEIPDAFRTGDGTLTHGILDVSLSETTSVEVESIYITIYVDVFGLRKADLSFTLIAPDGKEALIAALDGVPQEQPYESRFQWTFSVEAFRGYDSAGVWKIRVEDSLPSASDNLLQLRSVELDFYGADHSNDDLHHFTDDFLTLSALDPARRVLDDLNGGTDWANFSAIAGRIVANMAANGAVTVGGEFWTRFAAGTAQIENFHAGDGDDQITGNAMINHIIGARGNDVIKGIGGNDSIEGGQGNDNLNGGSHLDVLIGGLGNDVLVGATGHDTLTGGNGADAFVFALNFGRDVITDFQDNLDTLRLDDRLWGGGKTISQVLAQYAGLNAAGDVTLTFDRSVLTLTGVSDQAVLVDDILII